MAIGYLVIPEANNTFRSIPAVKYNTKSMGWSAPAGGAFASRADMLQFIKWIFASSSANASEPVLSQSYKDEYLAPGMNLADGISQFGQGTWETFYANGYWTLTKGGLTASMATSLAVVPALKLGLIVMININSGSAVDSLSAQVIRGVVPLLTELFTSSLSPAYPLPNNYTAMLGAYGPSADAPYVTMQSEDSTASTGILSGSLLVMPEAKFVWEPKASSEFLTAFRYYSSNSKDSCMNQAGSGSAILYLESTPSGFQATLPDQNGNFYGLPKIA